MRKIKYPEISRMRMLLTEYKELFSADIGLMQDNWQEAKDQLRHYSNAANSDILYPENMADVFVKTYPELVDMYLDYVQIQGTKIQKKYEDLHSNLKLLFHYSGESNQIVRAYQPKIAEFFMKHSMELGISVCYYCETSYINTYGFSSLYDDVAKFLASADKITLMRYVRKSSGEPYTDKTIEDIYKLCHGKTEATAVANFDNYRFFKNMNPKKSEALMNMRRNHFDLDHFLPKSQCPLVGLSFYNFVPSCSVCNEKLKGADMIGGVDRKRLLALSPTSSYYRFADEITIQIKYNTNVSTLRMQEHPDDFILKFVPQNNRYQEIISEFRLDERYNYHKQIALKLHDLYQDFAPGHIKQLEYLFENKKSYGEIENQIFRGEYSENDARCFDKLKNDIKKQCGR